ncbi:hypothetical protein OHA02_14805 [Streptomyces phaeochromogenes]|nr:hypothetical protein [Streptomyces phaeochromogenes]
MADDDTGGTVLRLRVPGAVGDDPPPAPDGFPALASVPGLSPPASLSLPEPVNLTGHMPATHPDSGMPDDSENPGHGVAAMSVVMMTGITVAAMRGAYHVAAYLKARQEHHRAIADQQKAAAGKAKLDLEMARIAANGTRQKARIQSGPEFGRSRSSQGGAGRHGSARNTAPAALRAPAPPKSPTGSTSRAGGKTAGGLSGRRLPAPRDRRTPKLDKPRRKDLEAPGKNKNKGKTDRGPGIGSAIRDRAASRIRSGPVAKPERTPGIKDAARSRVADRLRNGPAPKPVKPERHPGIRNAARARVADRITSGSWKPTGPKPDKAPKTIRDAVRARIADRIRTGPKPTPDAPKTDFKKGPKAGTKGSTTAPEADAKTARRKARKAKSKRPGGPGPASAAPGSKSKRTSTAKGAKRKTDGPKARGKGRSTRDRWERTGARRTHGKTTGPKTPGASGGASGTGASAGPPPGWGHAQGVTWTVTRDDAGPGAQARRWEPRAVTRGRAALPAGTTKGGPMTVPVPAQTPNTQYADAELTIYDVIEADADMAEEITQGAEEAHQAAEGCDVLRERLEALHAKILELKVPGVLEGLVLLLWEKAANVKAHAEAVAEKIPAASEAIAQAGTNAETRHRPLADAVRDAGHTAPAERDYHNE